MTQRNPLRAARLGYDGRILLTAFLAGVPGSSVALALLWTGDYSVRTQWTVTAIIVALSCAFAFSLREKVTFPLKTLSNLLAALREGDYSVRGYRARPDDALGEVMLEVNSLGDTLREQRLGALEATTLLRTVMAEIDVAVFAFDGESRLRLVNRTGERLLAKPAERIIGQSADELGLDECLRGEPARTLDRTFSGAAGRWGLRRTAFREKGLQHQLLVVSDLTRALREEEFQAWQRLVRVLGHEINNSLAPIRSIAGSLDRLLTREPQPEDWRADMHRGLGVIGSRAEALGRFTAAYAQLARLPQPRFAPLDCGDLLRHVVRLEPRMTVVLTPGPPAAIPGDRDQLEQLLINLLRNAVDAALETNGGVEAGWRKVGAFIEVRIADRGPGLGNTANLFVPFFTTKQGGSGIGLVLSRQIAEAHGGTLTLENRSDGAGCEAKLRLPV